MAERASMMDQPLQGALPLEGAPLDPAEAALPPAKRRPIFTGEGLARSDPGRYALFCRLFFEAGLGQMEACRMLGMSPQSGAAIIAREQAGMRAERLRSVQAARARAVVSLCMSAIQERLSDPAELADIPLRDLGRVLRDAHEVGALLAGALLAFALSFDEVIVTTFTAGQQTTLPIWMFQELIRPRQRPVTNVVAVVIIALTFVPILLAYSLTRADEPGHR